VEEPAGGERERFKGLSRGINSYKGGECGLLEIPQGHSNKISVGGRFSGGPQVKIGRRGERGRNSFEISVRSLEGTGRGPGKSGGFTGGEGVNKTWLRMRYYPGWR